ncbi:hypothetical protein SAMN05443429_10894 [Cruoricaptor ignavus]|uniref:Phage minor structural protein, N-terminal region n=1 Tax=Cruoricaptor ignavus TaxID=1118202 RepID=A0A1M6G8A0_9FLAO|nr:hypothetical protein [Cruoricaptor ignavus]SHJ06134.1 hypothetical protein SAMN05443429_10894 [Cruoricaptor ignavus]
MMWIRRNGQNHLNLVKRGSSTVVSASQNRAILSDDSVTLRVASKSVLDVKVNDTFEVFGEVYRINQEPTVQKNSSFEYDYTIVGQGVMFDLLRCKFFNSDGNGWKSDLEFPIIGDLELFLTVVKNNMLRFGGNWEVGSIPQDTETKTINFSDDSCLSALQKICNEYKVEFWIKREDGRFKIHTGQFGSTLPIPFEYGKGKGLYQLTRRSVDEQQIINRLYAYGGSENIPAGYRNFAKRLQISDNSYLEDAEMIAANGLKEGSINFEEVYPKRTGKITAVNGLTKIADASMDFDLNAKEADGSTKYLVAGQTAKMHFNTGNLAGYEFEIHKYDHDAKEFTLIPFHNEQGREFPDKDSAAFQFSVGDEYVLLDIVMPETYITNAEAELLRKAKEQFNLMKQAKVSYDLQIDASYLKLLNKLPEIGDLLNVRDSALGIDKVLRINQITREFIKDGERTDFDYKIVIADSYEVSYASQMVLEMQDIRSVVNNVRLGLASTSRLGYRLNKELQDSIFDTDGYFDPDNIRPLSIETSMLSVGAQSQQLSTSLILRTNVGNDPDRVAWNNCQIYSQTMDKVWTIAEGEQTISGGTLYVYGKAGKSGSKAVLHFTAEKIAFDSKPSDYYFLLGILSSVIEGYRVFVPTIGMTTITGGLIRTGIISSNDGATTFNLNTGEISGRIRFASGSSGYANISDAPDVENLQIGGRNYIRDSRFEKGYWEFESNRGTITIAPRDIWGVPTPAKKNALNYFSDAGENYLYFKHFIDVEPGEYTLSFWVKSDGAFLKSGCAVMESDPSTTHKFFDIPFTNEWRKVVVRLNIATDKVKLRLGFNSNGNAWISVADIKLEKGQKATDWTPAPEDVDAAISAVEQRIIDIENNADYELTTIDGNVITTGTLSLGDTLGANAGITGNTQSSVFLYGGTNFGNRNNAPISLHRDGFMRVRDAQGRVIFEIGQKDGKAVFNIYNENGTLVAEIGQQGIIFQNFIPESYQPQGVRKLNSSIGDYGAMANEIRQYVEEEYAFSGEHQEGGNVRAIKVSLNTDRTIYYYHPGNNFESAGNQQYVGYYDEKNKLGQGTSGVFALYKQIFYLEGDGYNFSVEVYRIENGKIMESKIVQIK